MNKEELIKELDELGFKAGSNKHDNPYVYDVSDYRVLFYVELGLWKFCYDINGGYFEVWDRNRLMGGTKWVRIPIEDVASAILLYGNK